MHMVLRSMCQRSKCLCQSVVEELGPGVNTGLFTALTMGDEERANYFTPQGEFRVDAGGSPTLLNCLMYKMAYFRFGEVQVGLPW